jgi:putative phosphoribosyl transferase
MVKHNVNLGKAVEIPLDGISLRGDLTLLPSSTGLILFAYGSGSSRYSPRERFVSDKLNHEGFSTLFIDLLTAEEEREDAVTLEYRFNIPLLAGRLETAMDWAKRERDTSRLKMGLFGGSTGAAACLIAAAEKPERVSAVVSRGGRTDLAEEVLPRIRAATLFIVGGSDPEILELNNRSLGLLTCLEKKLEVVPRATHLFEEPGKLDEVARLACEWFKKFLK